MHTTQRVGHRRPRRRQRRGWLWALVTVAVLAVVLAGGVAGAGWYFAGEVRDQALAVDHEQDDFDLRIASTEQDTVLLRSEGIADEDNPWQDEGVYGLEWPGGYGQVTTIVEFSDTSVRRIVSVLEGELPENAPARVDQFAYPGDPLRAFGTPFEDVTISGELGELEAWLVRGQSSTWAILVHGRNSRREEMLRQLPAFRDAGMNVLVITYRNDAGAAPEEDGRHHFGATEWADLEAAAEFAVSQNAGELVLSGASMGGAIVMSFLNRSDLAELVTAVVLDAPVLDLETAVKHAAPGWAPGFILDAGTWFTSRRFDVDWEEVDYLRDTARLQAPMLVFHGLEDDTVPAELSERFAEARPDLVTYVPVAGAGHVRSWNADPERYMAALSGFLTEHAAAGE